jgi:flagellin
MDLLARVGPLLNNLVLTRQKEAVTTQRLSTGLRINGAADDPSGLAISEQLRTQITGMQRGQENAQTAGNMLSVAEGHLSTVTSILQRIRSLIVEGRSSLESTGDLNAIQTEIDALKQEINSISGSASFNGIKLLDGSLDNTRAKNATVAQITAEPNVNGDVGPTNVTNADGLGNAGPLVQNATVGNNVEQATIEIQVIGFDQNAVDPITGPIGGPGLYVQVVAYSSDPSFGNGQEVNQVSAIPENGGQATAILNTPSGSSTFFQFTLANLTRNDVGAAMAFTTSKNTQSQTGQPLSVNDRGNEGTDVSVTIPQMSETALGIAGVTVAAPTIVDPFSNVATGTDSNTISAKDAMVRVDGAIQTVVAVRAVVGAQQIALQNSVQDSSIQTVATQASESSIRDANIGAEVSDNAKNTILDNIANDALASVQSGEKALGSAFASMISTGPPGGKLA